MFNGGREPLPHWGVSFAGFSCFSHLETQSPCRRGSPKVAAGVPPPSSGVPGAYLLALHLHFRVRLRPGLLEFLFPRVPGGTPSLAGSDFRAAPVLVCNLSLSDRLLSALSLRWVTFYGKELWMLKARNTCFVFTLTQVRCVALCARPGESGAVTSHSVTSWPAGGRSALSEGSGQEGPGSQRCAGRAC